MFYVAHNMHIDSYEILGFARKVDRTLFLEWNYPLAYQIVKRKDLRFFVDTEQYPVKLDSGHIQMRSGYRVQNTYYNTSTSSWEWCEEESFFV